MRKNRIDDCSTLYTSISAPQPVFVKVGKSTSYIICESTAREDKAAVLTLLKGLFEPKDITQKPSVEFFCRNLESWNETFKGVEAKDTQ